MNYSKLPKIELHLHLDCSLSYDVVKKISPAISVGAFKMYFIAPPRCIDLADYILRAGKGIDLMQTKTQLRLVTLDLFDQLKNDNVIYAEIRFAPLQHLKEGLRPQEIVETVNSAVSEGIAETGIEGGLILCTLRHFTDAQSMETVKLVEQFQGTNVVGFDIGADEAHFPIDNHIRAFSYACDSGLNITAHAGEARGADSIRETLKHFHPSRIGHGIRSIEDPELLELLMKEDIHLEVCPTSNVQTNVVNDIANHPVDNIYRSGVSLSLSTDCRTISNITLADEYRTMSSVFGWGEEHYLKCNLEAIKHSFTTTDKKAQLKEKLISMFACK